MKKAFILLLLFVLSCGPTEAEIQSRVDSAVKEALASTTSSTLITPTPTPITKPSAPLSEYEKCRRDVQALLGLYEGEYRKISTAYNNYVDALRSSSPFLLSFDFDDIEVQRAWIDLTDSLEVVLMAKSNLALPENRTTYQEYYLTFQKIINTDVKIYEHWLRIQSGFSREVHLEGIRKNIELSDGLRYELYDITYCQK